jgi:3-dehydroquinate dehydratase-2
MKSFLLLNGPNLNLLGKRETDIYGENSLEQIEAGLVAFAKKNKVELMTFQRNAEHELVDRIQAGKEEKVSCILFNPGAFTHTSVALRDAILGVDIPLIEIHISNIFNREAFREKSYFSDIAVGIISGFGEQGYKAALELACNIFISNCSNLFFSYLIRYIVIKIPKIIIIVGSLRRDLFISFINSFFFIQIPL